MRIWDFGWQRALKGWGPRGRIGKMRLLPHATDPANLEGRIGRAASDGCIRIPTALNRFLDSYGVLDAGYEREARHNIRFASLLLSDRSPTPLAGDALVVVDSSETPAMQGSTMLSSESVSSLTGDKRKDAVQRHSATHHSRRVAEPRHRHRA